MTPTMTPPPQVQRQLATRAHGKQIGVIIAVIVGAALAGATWALLTRGPASVKQTLAAGTRPWMQQAATYPDVEKPVAQIPPAPVDTTLGELAKLRSDLLAMRLRMDELEKRKSQTTVINQGQQGQGQVKPPEKRPAPMLYFAKDIQDKPGEGQPQAPEYVLAPGATKIPCLVETSINSEVEGYFTAKVSTNVYDTATGRHLLVPQNSTILGHDQSASLLYGNERLPTVSLKLALPDKRTVDLGQAPVTDQRGVAGLTGKVDNHYGRLFAAVFIGGALRGGMQALQSSMAQAGGVGQVAAGIGSFGNQVVSQRAGRALDTRPTITLEGGEPCTVLLTKELRLPAMWQTAGARP